VEGMHSAGTKMCVGGRRDCRDFRLEFCHHGVREDARVEHICKLRSCTVGLFNIDCTVTVEAVCTR
jgi:hypothetical protein